MLVERDILDKVLTGALAGGGEFAEIFVEEQGSTSAVLDDGRVEELSTGSRRGAGIRVVSGGATGYAHTADLSEPSLLEAARPCHRFQEKRQNLKRLHQFSSGYPVHCRSDWHLSTAQLSCHFRSCMLQSYQTQSRR